MTQIYTQVYVIYRVTQGDWIWHYLIDGVRTTIRLPLQLWLYLVPFSN